MTRDLVSLVQSIELRQSAGDSYKSEHSKIFYASWICLPHSSQGCTSHQAVLKPPKNDTFTVFRTMRHIHVSYVAAIWSFEYNKEYVCYSNLTYPHHQSPANTKTLYLLAEATYSISSPPIQHIPVAERQLAPRDLAFESFTTRFLTNFDRFHTSLTALRTEITIMQPPAVAWRTLHHMSRMRPR